VNQPEQLGLVAKQVEKVNPERKKSLVTIPPPGKPGDRRAANWNLFSKNSPENYFLIEDLVLINMGLSDKAAALTLTDRAMAVIPVEKDALSGPRPIEILARVASRVGEPDRAIAALQKLLSISYSGPLRQCR
jgi:hypothetical protein